jgi:hypothetical protein
VKACDQVKDGSLARAVRADDADRLAFAHAEAERINRDKATESLRQVMDFEQGHAPLAD